MTFWSGDDDVGGVVPLIRGVALEGCAICGSGRCHGKKGEDLVEDSSYWCPWWWKAEECMDIANGGLGAYLLVEGGGLVRPCANCDHKDGEEAGASGFNYGRATRLAAACGD